MHPYIAQFVAVSRQEEFIREAAAERQARRVRRARKRDARTDPPPTPGRHHTHRPVTA